MALLSSENPDGISPRLIRANLMARIKTWLADNGDRSLAQRIASAAFLIRILSAALAFGSQVLLARWMGSFEFGVFVYVWTCVMLIGGAVDLGLASSAQRFIPQYLEDRTPAKLRGFLAGSRWLAFTVAIGISILGALSVRFFADWLDPQTVIPLYIACLILPVYGVLHVQDGIARSFNWVNLALLPAFVFRQIILIGLMGAAYLSGFATDATTGIIIAAISVWAVALGQMIALNRKLKTEVGAGDKAYEIPRWVKISLPMFVVDGLYLMLMYVDVLILKHYRTPEEVAVYYAAAKILALVAFVYFAVSAASAHKFSEYYVTGDRKRLGAFVADAIRWTFWPSLAATGVILVCGWPLLRLFGSQFVQGYELLFVLAIGLLARAAIGPGERFLSMLGEQNLCTAAALIALATNLTLCVMLIPSYGVVGAAMSTSTAFIVESVLIFIIAKRRLGFHLFIWGRPTAED